MANNNPLTQIVGVVGRNPEVKETRKGPVTKFSIAHRDGYGDDGTTTWWEIGVFNEGLQDQVQREVYKGTRIVVEGTASTRDYQGQTYHDLLASRVGTVTWLERSKRSEDF